MNTKIEDPPSVRSQRTSLARRVELTFDQAPFRSVILPGLLCIGLLATAYAMRSILVPLTFAVMLYFLLRPVVTTLARWHVPRLVGSTLVLGAVLGALAFVALELATPASAWAERLPSALHWLEERSRSLNYPLDLASPLLLAAAKAAEEIGADRVLRAATLEGGQLKGLVEGAATFTTQLVLTVVLSYFLLLEGDNLVGRLSRTSSAPARSQRAALMLNEVSLRMSRYLGTVTLINVGFGAALAGALSLLGMPNPWLWGCLAALLTYVPYLGPAVGIGLVTLASFITFPTSGEALAPPLVYLALSTIEGNVVTPLLLGRTLRVSPLILFAWLTVWAWLWSVPGAILACPLLMLLKLACDESPRAAGIAYVLGR